MNLISFSKNTCFSKIFQGLVVNLDERLYTDLYFVPEGRLAVKMKVEKLLLAFAIWKGSIQSLGSVLLCELADYKQVRNSHTGVDAITMLCQRST